MSALPSIHVPILQIGYSCHFSATECESYYVV